jgi:hypothetical protein
MFERVTRRARMGLCIHWTVHAPEPVSLESVTERLSAWRDACLDLPFDSVTDIVHFDREAIERVLDDVEAPARWFVVQAGAYCPGDPDDPDSSGTLVDPLEVVGFTAYLGETCEPMNCLLARYPDEAEVNGSIVRPGVSGWRGSTFAKTQYASTVSTEYFLKCHLTAVAALDAAKRLGLLKSVVDDSGYWDNRNVEALIETIARWNTMTAGLVGALELATGEDTPSPIKRHPDFERLEHLGLNRETAILAKAIARVLKKEKG